MPSKEEMFDFYDISIIIPFYKKLSLFKKIFPRNQKYFERNGIEVILVVDEPSEERDLLRFIAKYPFVNWKVIVNDNFHEWRNPAKAINIGIKNASFKYLLICSPETEFPTDAIGTMRKIAHYYSNVYIIGSVVFLDISQLGKTVKSKAPAYPYGSLFVSKSDMIKIRGYDETFSKWGGEDDNVRSRLDLNGMKRMYVPEIRLYHYEIHSRKANKSTLENTPIRLRESKSCVSHPPKSISNGKCWGADYKRIACDWKVKDESTYDQCLKYLENFEEKWIVDTQKLLEKKNITALVQLYNEVENVTPLLEHLDEHCDAIIILDDGSTDGTWEKAVHPKIMMKVKKKRIEFNDLENRNLLLKLCNFTPSNWFFFIDADERFDVRYCDWKKLTKNTRIDSVAFYLIHLWNKETLYRRDAPFSYNGLMLRWRMFRYLGAVKIYSSLQFHFHAIPFRRNKLIAEVLIHHYGMLLKTRRIEKYEFYINADRQNDQKNYDHIIDEDARTADVVNITIPQRIPLYLKHMIK